MIVTTLLENTACDPKLHNAHGLSQYIEACGHKILFDMGPDAATLDNAAALGVDLKAVDMAVLSHGHYDHAGGLSAFLKHNDSAPVYLSRLAMGAYYAVDPGCPPEYIGVPPVLTAYRQRMVFTDEQYRLADGLTLFSDVETADYRSGANDKLREKVGEDYPLDAFRHEQNLLIQEDGKAVLMAGCAHRGIVNILRRAEALLGRAPDVVFAGFHLFNPGLGQSEPAELVDAVGQELERRDTLYYTGHCTGAEAFDILKRRLGQRLQPMPGGASHTI